MKLLVEVKIFGSSAKIRLGNPGIFILNCMVFSKSRCVLYTPNINTTGKCNELYILPTAI